MRIRADWSPDMERRAAPDDRQVKCLIASAGHQWMRGYFDQLPSAVRHRLAQGRFNLCAACLTEEAERVAATRGLRRPTIGVYNDVITAIEQKLVKK